MRRPMSYARRTISCTSSGSSSTSLISLSRRFTPFAARSGKREELAAPTVADSGQSIDPIRIGQGYFLEPDGQVANKPYTLLRTALERNSKAAVAKFAWHGRERLGLLRIKDDAIILHAMRWPDEIRSPRAWPRLRSSSPRTRSARPLPSWTHWPPTTSPRTSPSSGTRRRSPT
ncbi:Ku protein [Streptomyces sp. AcE210]|uniref:Ku protein n=1 Tax=Streptomyces sp. AcE210 TaxID=2292703 RepID=UPI003204686E